MLRGRGKGTAAFDIALVATFVILAYVFLTRRSYMTKVDQTLDVSHQSNKNNKVNPPVKGSNNNNEGLDINSQKRVPKRKNGDKTKEELEQEQIIEKVKHVPDARTSTCKGETPGAEVPASIIIDFFDYSFYDMKVTLESVRQFTPDSLIREIIIVDDGTTLDYILADVKSYIAKVPKSVLLRNEERQGQAMSRMRAANEAMGANLIFLDPTVIVTKGWIEPLVAFIQKEKQVIAVPHHDRINDPVTYDYVKTDMDMASSLSWALEVKMTRTKDVKKADVDFPTAAMRGNVFAITKAYFREIGGLDQGLSDGGGDSLELSIRTWLCGGAIKILPCSRVGILNFHDSVKITSNRNKWRLIQLWMKDHEKIIHVHVGRNPEDSITKNDRVSLDNRKAQLSKLQCRPFSWYIDAIAKDVYVPPTDSEQHGLLQIQNGRCARVGDDSRIDLGSCSADQHNLLSRDLVFSLTRDGYLKWGSMCLSVKTSAYILAEQCSPGDDHQLWKYDKEKRLANKWSNFCAMHVTDPDPKLKNEKRQIVMAQGCDSDNTDKKEFSSWKFIEA